MGFPVCAVACADSGEGAVEVAFDGAEREAGGCGDLGKLHLVDEAEEEDGALAVGESSRRSAR